MHYLNSTEHPTVLDRIFSYAFLLNMFSLNLIYWKFEKWVITDFVSSFLRQKTKNVGIPDLHFDCEYKFLSVPELKSGFNVLA